jgi:hypothetical protein
MEQVILSIHETVAADIQNSGATPLALAESEVVLS